MLSKSQDHALPLRLVKDYFIIIIIIIIIIILSLSVN
jgi:hypothetical protein